MNVHEIMGRVRPWGGVGGSWGGLGLGRGRPWGRGWLVRPWGGVGLEIRNNRLDFGVIC